MKPVLIQTLMKRNKDKIKSSPMTEEEKKHHDNVMGSVIFWFVVGLVIAGLLIA